MKLLKIAAYVVGALIAFKIAMEVLSIVTSLPVIILALAVWWFLIRNRSSSTH